MFVYLYITEPKDALSLPLIYSYSPLLYNTDFSSLWLEFTDLAHIPVSHWRWCMFMFKRSFFLLWFKGVCQTAFQRRETCFESIINLALYVRSSFTVFCLYRKFLMFNVLIQSVLSTKNFLTCMLCLFKGKR